MQCLTAIRPRIVSLGFLVAVTACTSTEPGKDYLTAELRSREEQLKKDVVASPTTAENIQARTDILWDWANAYSLTGGPIPVNLPQDAAYIRIARTDGFVLPAPGIITISG